MLETILNPPRLFRVRPRSLSPESRLNDGSKRTAVKCDFFAKGWCIKGNSCRFLHINSHHKEDTTGKKSELLDEEASSVQLIPHSGESPRVKCLTQESHLLKNDPFVPSSQDFRQETNRENYGSDFLPMAKGSSLHGIFSSSYARISETYGSRIDTPHMTSLEEMTCTRSKFLANDHNLPASVSCLPKPPLSFTYPSWNTDLLSTQKLLDSGQEDHSSRSASGQRSSSPFSGSESENVSRTNAFNDEQYAAGSKTKILYDWEPSVPFRPSFLMTRRLLSSASLYDPIRDSIEKTSSVVGVSKISGSVKEASVLGARMQADADSFPTGTLGTECSSNKYSVPFSAKNFSGKDVSTAEERGIFGTQLQNRKSLLKEQRLLDSERGRDVTEADKMSLDCNSKLETSGQHSQESKEERTKQILEADADLKVEESRALKNFHTSLVEVVKDLLKPSWHKGVLSKDAYKIIVKKTVEKVLSTLQPHQVPSTSESVKQYLSLSQTKLAKVVEGYVRKYGKSPLG
ncbi:hypothetical protein ACH5RR_017940 [Cinchona calisaya]|uniref:C3H1-type domain-containing protein n=1 Tax=Cinchona calisaya TaxID=153742 RepID=A0ABD2ZLQ8_9GENT